MQLRPHQKQAIQAMIDNDKGQVIVPTGGGKTICMIQDAKREFESEACSTIVVVAPRILLANQLSAEFLEFITNVKVMHVHSGDCLLYTSPSPRDRTRSRMPSSA